MATRRRATGLPAATARPRSADHTDGRLRPRAAQAADAVGKIEGGDVVVHLHLLAVPLHFAGEPEGVEVR